ncbi:MAG: hypothetical protein JW878_08360 [Methanomicrobia archaeon]|nr:hypothetical protein [Methanomicrobia archaeon]
MAVEETVEEIIWLDDPYKWDYLRESVTSTTRSDYVMRQLKKSGLYKLVGYDNFRKKGKSTVYHKHVWWLAKHDKDCPEAIPDYQAGVKKPSGAINPREIKIPDGIRIIKDYEIERAVKECSSDNDYDKEYNKAKEEKWPFLVIRKNSKYAYFRFDMWPINYNLSDEGLAKFRDCIDDFFKNIPEDYKNLILKKSNGDLSGASEGSSPKLRIYECRILSKKLKEIVLDKKNWEELARN